MRFDRPLCPKCECPAAAVLTQVAGRLEIAPTEDGAFERTGQTLLWGTERPQTAEGLHLLRCECGEVWTARRLDEELATDCAPGPLPPFSPDSAPCNPPPAAEACCEMPRDTDALRAEVRRRLAARRRHRTTAPPSPAPRYDEVFLAGTAWLDRL